MGAFAKICCEAAFILQQYAGACPYRVRYGAVLNNFIQGYCFIFLEWTLAFDDLIFVYMMYNVLLCIIVY